MINSLGPKRLLKTQISGKKGNLSSEKKLLTIYSRFIEYNKPQATNSKGPQGVLTITVEVTRSSLTPRGLLKTQFFEKKKANSPVKESFWSFFSRIIECDKS